MSMVGVSSVLADGFDARLSAGVDAVVMRTAERLPDGVKRRLAGPYNRMKMTQADRAFAARTPTPRTPVPDGPDHVVVVVVDALRADAVDRHTCPFIAERDLGAAITPAPWTFPAVTSLFTGRYPHEHGAMRQSNGADRGATELVIPPRLPDDAETISDVFAGAGYRTYGGFAFHMPFFALSGRFDRHVLYDKSDAETVLEGALEWLDGKRDGRTFSYLHLGDLHEPIDLPARYVEAYDVDTTIPDLASWDYVDVVDPGPDGERYRRHRRRLYDAALAYVDDQLRRFHEQIVERLGPNVALVVTADHGEAFWEHVAFDAEHFVDSRPAYSVDHGGTPYEPIARVPLVVDGIDVAPIESVTAPPSLVDVAPTLLDALGHPDALPTSGCSLVDGVPADRIPIVEAARYGHEKKAAYLDGWKLLTSNRDGTSVTYSLPEEELADVPPNVERRLRDALPPWPDGEGVDVRVSGLARERLEDLGYV